MAEKKRERKSALLHNLNSCQEFLLSVIKNIRLNCQRYSDVKEQLWELTASKFCRHFLGRNFYVTIYWNFFKQKLFSPMVGGTIFSQAKPVGKYPQVDQKRSEQHFVVNKMQGSRDASMPRHTLPREANGHLVVNRNMTE